MIELKMWIRFYFEKIFCVLPNCCTCMTVDPNQPNFFHQNSTSDLTWSRMYLDICHCSQTFSTLISINNRKWLFSSQNLTDLLFVELSYVLQDFSFLPLAYTKVFHPNIFEMKSRHWFYFEVLDFCQVPANWDWISMKLNFILDKK